MKFYKELSRVYDIVFPKDDTTLGFLCKGLKGNSKVLDLACGTGTYSAALGLKGHRVEGIDLGEEMIELAKGKGGLYANFTVGDMTRIKEIYDEEKFDLIYCIGNSIVHLKNKEKIEKLIKDMYEMLNDEGACIIQVVNYDRVINHNVKSLPTIERKEKGVRFIRDYDYKEEEGKVAFQTELIVSKGDKEERYENSVDLIAVKKDELEDMFSKAGFTNIEAFGDFSEIAFSDETFTLVMRGVKK